MKKLIVLITIATFSAGSFAQSVDHLAALDTELKAEINSALKNTKVKTVAKKKVVKKNSTVKIDPTLEMADEAEAKKIAAKQLKAKAANIVERKDEAQMDRLMRESQEIKGIDYSVTDSSLDGVGNSSNDYMSNRMRTVTPFKKEKELIGLNFYTFFSSADDVGTTNNSLQSGVNQNSILIPSAMANGVYTAAPSYGLGLEYAKHALGVFGRVGLGIAIGGTYEMAREIDRGFTSSSTNGFGTQIGNNPKMALATPYVNAVAAYRNMYALGGINYAMPQVSEADDEIFQGALGFQFGAGMNVTNWMSVEANYRLINMIVNPKETNTFGNVYNSNFSRSGLGVLEQENLSMNGFVINFKFRL